MSLEIIVLAAGEGKRMHSALPKVLHPLAGRPLLAHVLDAVRALAPRKVFVVHGHGGEQVKSVFNGASVEWVEQAEQRGTGHAVMQALPRVDEQSLALVVYADVPLIRGETLRRLADAARGGLALLTAEPPSPDGYGRILRNANGAVERIVEHKDASPAERAVREINAGFLAASKPHLAG